MMKIKWAEIHQIDARLFAGEIGCSTIRHIACKSKENFSPIWMKRRENISYITGASRKVLRHPMGLSTPAYPDYWAHYTRGPNILSLINPSRYIGAHYGAHGSVSAPVVPPHVRIMPCQLRTGPAHINPFL